MSVISERLRERVGGENVLIDIFQELLREEAWEWFEENRDDELLRVRKWFFSFSVRVRDLRPLFEILFGPQPEPSSSPS